MRAFPPLLSEVNVIDANDNDIESGLVRRAKAGERAAWATLIARKRNGVQNLARRALRNADDAQDVTQEVFAYAYLHLNELRDAARWDAWIRQITVHAVADFRRSRATRSFPPPPHADLAAIDNSEERTRRILLRDALATLPEAQRLTVILHYIGGYELTETAELLSVPLNTVRSRLRLARAKLREALWMLIEQKG